MELIASKYSYVTQNAAKPTAAAAGFPPLPHRRKSSTPRPKKHAGRIRNASTASSGTSRTLRKKRHMFRLPRNQDATATMKATPADERAAMMSTGIGMSQVSHQCGCKPVAKNSANNEQAMAAIAHPMGAFFVGEGTQHSPVGKTQTLAKLFLLECYFLFGFVLRLARCCGVLSSRRRTNLVTRRSSVACCFTAVR